MIKPQKLRTKKKIKKEADDLHTNMLKKIDIILDEKDKKSNLDSLKNLPNPQNQEDQMLSVEDLLTNLETKNTKISKMKQQYSDLNVKGVAYFLSYYE